MSINGSRCVNDTTQRIFLWEELSEFVFVFVFQPPAGFSPKVRSGRDLSRHSSYGSLPQEVRDQTPPRTEGSPIRSYTSIEVTNVWGQQSRGQHQTDFSFVTAKSISRTFGFHVWLNRKHFFMGKGFYSISFLVWEKFYKTLMYFDVF